MWVYKERYEDGVCIYTVGFFGPFGEWYQEGSCPEKEQAAARVHWLNGGSKDG